MLEQGHQGIKELFSLIHQPNAVSARKESKRITVLRFGAKFVNFIFLVLVLNSPRKKLNGLKINASVCDFVTRVSSRISTSSLLQKPKQRSIVYLIL